MQSPLIAIVGSADRTRQYEPEVDTTAAVAIAREIGRELSKQGCRLLVYGSKFIEAQAVKGFADAKPRSNKLIIVRRPQNQASVFSEEKTHPALFEYQLDTSDEWEVSFYRSLTSSDGVVLLGGGLSTLIAGQVAIGARIPLVAIAQSGGAARKVWQTISPGEDLSTSDEKTLMGAPWTEGSAAAIVKALVDQQNRRNAVENKPIRNHAIAAAVLFCVSFAIALLSASSSRQIWELYLSGLIGGGSGGLIRNVYEKRFGIDPTLPSLTVSLTLGMIAGGLAAMLYAGAQPGSINLSGDAGLRVVFFTLIVSVVGGLTSETVYRKLLGLNVVHTRWLAEEVKSDAHRG
jgi:hypothetical protein